MSCECALDAEPECVGGCVDVPTVRFALVLVTQVSVVGVAAIGPQAGMASAIADRWRRLRIIGLSPSSGNMRLAPVQACLMRAVGATRLRCSAWMVRMAATARQAATAATRPKTHNEVPS